MALNIAAGKTGRRTQAFKAGALLKHTIERRGGQVDASEGMDILANAGIPMPVNRGTAVQVRRQAGVQTRRVGFGPGSRVVWYLNGEVQE